MLPTFCAAMLLATPPAAPSSKKPDDLKSSKTVELKSDALDEFTLKTGGVTFGNVLPSEVRSGEYQGAHWKYVPHSLTVRGTYRNSTAQSVAFTLVMVGLDGEGELLWACTVRGDAQWKGVGVFEGKVTVPEGTLQQTAVVRIRARVGAQPLMTANSPFPPAPEGVPAVAPSSSPYQPPSRGNP